MMENNSKTIDRLTNEILAEVNRVSNCGGLAEFVKLEFHDGEIKVTGVNDRSIFSRTIADVNIQTWYNRFSTEKEIRDQVEHFLSNIEKGES